MNCANHPDRERAAFCQNCGKPLCTECIRTMGTSIYCEPCSTARANATVPPASYGYTGASGHSTSGYSASGYTAPGPAGGYPPGYSSPGPPAARGEPNPGLAALLGFIPGVGAMYNEQYGKGFVHLIVFALLVSLSHDGGFSDVFGLFVFGWIVYMVIEAHHTARARRDGMPLPNPFGLNDISERLGFGRAWPGGAPGPAGYGAAVNPGANSDSTAQAGAGQGAAAGQSASGTPYGSPGTPYSPPYTPPYSYTYAPPIAHWGAPQDAYRYGVPPTPPVPPVPPMPGYPDANLYQRRFPTGAVWLIALGLLFLVGNSSVFHMFHGRLFLPIMMIGLGVWLFVHKMTDSGLGLENDGTALYHWRLTRAISASFWVMLLGVLWLLDALGILHWSHNWPIFLIAVGVLQIFKRSAYWGSGYGTGYPGPGRPAPPAAAPVTTTALVPSASSERAQEQPGNGEEGR